MKAEEKANQLIEKFRNIKRTFYVTLGKPLPRAEAIQCAIICVEEIIKQISEMPLQNSTRAYRKDKNEYWNEVLTHLKNKK